MSCRVLCWVLRLEWTVEPPSRGVGTNRKRASIGMEPFGEERMYDTFARIQNDHNIPLKGMIQGVYASWRS